MPDPPATASKDAPLDPPRDPPRLTPDGDPIAARIAGLGQDLLAGFGAVLDDLPDADRGPQALATALGLDKVLCSRLLKAIRKTRDPLAVAHRIPGPEPLRRFLRAARKAGAGSAAVDAAGGAAEAFQAFVRDEMGDRSSLEVVVSTWLPEARREFETRRKQAAYRAMSQLRGVSTRVRLSTVLLAPSADPDRLDLVWIMGYLGLRRLRPGATISLSTSRQLAAAEGEASPRHPEPLPPAPGASVEDRSYPDAYRLDAFCEAPAADLVAEQHGERTHYVPTGDGIGAASEVDFLLAEVNRAELPASLPVGSGRVAHFWCDVSTPTRHLCFDVFRHRDVYPGDRPELRLYDRTGGATGDVNDPANEAYRMHMAETLTDLGSDPAAFGTDAVGTYRDLLRDVFARLGWDPTAFTGSRVAIEHPLLGTQVAQVYHPPQR